MITIEFRPQKGQKWKFNGADFYYFNSIKDYLFYVRKYKWKL